MKTLAYKFVVKENNKYIPLVNYGIDGGRKADCKPYFINKWNTNPVPYDIIKREGKFFDKNHLDYMHGYHFFKEKYPKTYTECNRERKLNAYDSWTKYLTKINEKEIKITVVLCELEDIKMETKSRYIANKFRIIKEVIPLEILEPIGCI